MLQRLCAIAGALLLLASPSLARKSYKLSRWNIPSAHYSGITPLGGGRYAVVADKEPMAGFYVWLVRQDARDGHIIEVQNEGFFGVPHAQRDAEGVAFCPQRQSLFISGEADQRVLEHRLDGTLTGAELRIPEAFGTKHIQPNRGFEALGYDTLQRLFWTCTESPLPGDGEKVRMLSFGPDMQLLRAYPYTLDTEKARNHGRDHYHGVVSLVAREDGSLLVLEREARIAKRYNGSSCWNRLFLFRPETGEKQPLNKWKTRFTVVNTRFANYEGMCLGATLDDGRQTLLLVADSQGGFGKGPWHLKDRLKVQVLPDGE